MPWLGAGDGWLDPGYSVARNIRFSVLVKPWFQIADSLSAVLTRPCFVNPRTVSYRPCICLPFS